MVIIFIHHDYAQPVQVGGPKFKGRLASAPDVDNLERRFNGFFQIPTVLFCLCCSFSRLALINGVEHE